jgi:hypothetical protein
MYYNGRLVHTVYVNVQAPPTPKVIPVTIAEDQEIRMNFPLNSYRTYAIEYLDTGRADFYLYYPNVRMRGRVGGSMKVYLQDYYKNNIYILDIKIISAPPTIVTHSTKEEKQLYL